MKFFLSVLVLVVSELSASAVTISTVSVGNPGNAADFRYSSSGSGAVSHSYNIGRTEITNAQYAEFLNAVAASDPWHLYTTSDYGIVQSGAAGSYSYSITPAEPGYAYDNKPVVYVSWYSALRFANWMHNGQGNGDTETGAYTLLGTTFIPTNANNITRNPGARWWVPSRDEWYKAAYFDPAAGVYHDYAVGTNLIPNNNLPENDNGNSVNFSLNGQYTTGNFARPLTDAGAYALSDSPYGTLDQSGNVSEWVETYTIGNPMRLVLGGTYYEGAPGIRASEASQPFAVNAQNSLGFRLAAIFVPEPSAGLLCLSAGAAVLVSLRRKSVPHNRV